MNKDNSNVIVEKVNINNVVLTILSMLLIIFITL